MVLSSFAIASWTTLLWAIAMQTCPSSGFLVSAPLGSNPWGKRSSCAKPGPSRRPLRFWSRDSTLLPVSNSYNDTLTKQIRQQRLQAAEPLHEAGKEEVSTSSNLYKDRYEFNQELNRLAELASDYRRANVVASAAACEEAWQKMGEETSNSKHDWEPDIVSFNTVLKAWTRCCNSLAEQRHDDHQQSVDIQHLEDVPDVPVYTALDAAERALHLLNRQEEVVQEEMERREDGNDAIVEGLVIPDVKSYNTVMDAFSKSRSPRAPTMVQELMDRLKKSKHLDPDSMSWNTLLETYSYSDQPDRLEKLDKIWKQMEKINAESPEAGVKPTVRTFNSIIYAYGRRISYPSSAKNAEKKEAQLQMRQNADTCLELFSQMKARYDKTKDHDDQPDAMTYTSVIHALSNCQHISYTRKAESLFQELRDLYQKTNDERFRPTVNTYTVMILAWARTPTADAPGRAEAVLEELLADEKVRPNVKSFTAAITAWARSRDARKAAKVLKLVQRMKSMQATNPEVAPSLVTYAAALDACHRTKGTPAQEVAALKIAFALLKSIEMDPVLKPNNTIYLTLLRATSSLLTSGEERNSIAKAIFDKAVASGQVDETMVRTLERSYDSDLSHQLLAPLENEQGWIDIKKIPQTWKRNVGA